MKITRRLRAYWANSQNLQSWDFPPSSAPWVVTLTTVPSRIALIKPTVLSLLRQTLHPGRIEINLGEVPPKPSERWLIPDWLQELKAVQLHWINPDLGPASKWIPTVRRYEGTETLIVVVDDDMIYAPTLLESLVAADRQAKGRAVFCGNGHPITRNLRFFDHPSDKAISVGQRRVAIVEGCGGYTLRPQHFDCAALTALDGVPAGALRNDDIWVSGLLSRRGIPKYQIPVGKRHSLPQAETSAIGGARAEASDALLRYFERDWAEDEIC